MNESKLKAAAMDSVGELPAGYLHLPTTPIKQEPELTDWISGDILPTIDGVYQRDYFSHYKKKTVGYSLFKNGKWHGGVRTSEYGSIDRASNVGKVSSIQNLPWRGLAKNPEVQP